MPVAEIKASAATAPQVQQKRDPFFSKEGQAPFFSKSRETTSSFFNRAHVQTKLTIGQPNDKYEVEADAMADKVVQRLSIKSDLFDFGNGSHGTVQKKCAECEKEDKVQPKSDPLATGITRLQRKPIFESNAEMPEAEVQRKAINNGLLQMKCEECTAEEEEGAVQRKSLQSAADVPSDVTGQISASKGKGDPLGDNVKKSMESGFGADFSGVRIHTGGHAIQMSRGLNAQAFTHGRDIYFNQGKFDHGSHAGRHLLAHELTHTIQQGASNKIQKQSLAPSAIIEHGDISQVPEDVRSDCTIATSSPANEQSVPYTHNSARLTPESDRILNEFTREWHRRGANANVRIDGYASVEGGEILNWRLSCSRAKTVRGALVRPSDGSPGIPESFIAINAHGETNRFSQTTLSPNRLATITSTIPVNPTPPTPPTPPPTPDPVEAKVCGPNVSTEVARVWGQIQSDFAGWGFGQKEAACRYLIQPVIINPSTGRLGLNIDAFDTLGLFLNTAGWTQRPPYHPPCGVPGSSGNPCDNRDAGHEDPNRCSNTVQIGSGCWLTGTANYGTYGIMMKLCYDWINSPLAILLLPLALRQALSQGFSYSTMISLITAYKLYDRENPALPIAWSSATYLGGPGSSPSGGNRPDCQPTCPIPFSTPAFDYVWEPTKARGSISPIYDYPCTTLP